MLVLGGPAAADPRAQISADEWARPHGGASLATNAGLREVIQGFREKAGREIVIRYHGGDAGQLWAEELRDWLVAMGVPSSAIVLVAGGTDGAAVIVTLEAATIR
jgi:hypothetical protein